MHRGLMLPCFVLAVFLLAALLAPPAYWAMERLSSGSPSASFLQELAAKPFPKYVSRLAIILALLGLYPLVRVLKASWRDAGVSRPDWPQLGRGALLALVTLGALIAVAFWFDARDWRRATPERLWRAVIGGMQAAVAVSLIEELIFRGVLFGLLRRGRTWIPALAISSTIFAVVHFMESPDSSGPGVQWHSGFAVLGTMLFPAGAESARLPQFVNLWLCGAILAWAYQRTGNLWFSIGLHGGWIFWLKFANSVTRTAPEAVAWWGTRKLIDGWSTTILLALTAALIAWLTRSRSFTGNATPNPQSMVRLG